MQSPSDILIPNLLLVTLVHIIMSRTCNQDLQPDLQFVTMDAKSAQKACKNLQAYTSRST
jgi:hypothetical protein